MREDELLERLAEVEQEQWRHWPQSVAAEISAERRQRWQACCVPNQDLPEDVKELDPFWARKALEALQRC